MVAVAIDDDLDFLGKTFCCEAALLIHVPCLLIAFSHLCYETNLDHFEDILEMI